MSLILPIHYLIDVGIMAQMSSRLAKVIRTEYQNYYYQPNHTNNFEFLKHVPRIPNRLRNKKGELNYVNSLFHTLSIIFGKHFA